MNLAISFSGGKTSAYMAKRLMDEWRAGRLDYEQVRVVFANTGCEHEKTLEYVHACDLAYGLSVVWIEALVHEERGIGTTHRVLEFKTASRNGQPFSDFNAKYGLPNVSNPACTRELKDKAITSYLRSINWGPRDYKTAIGIRSDEADRMSPNAESRGFIYPLVRWGVTKADVLAWEMAQPVRLGIPEHLGNCTWCWKKSLRKLATVAREMPEAFDFPKECEKLYADCGTGAKGRRFFRGHRTVADIFAVASDPNFEPFVDKHRWSTDEMDLGSSCGESCEIGSDEQTEFDFMADAGQSS